MRLVLVCGPWSSGTSVVAAMLDQLGARGLPPYFTTNDPRTPNSFESLAFRALVGELADEASLSLKADPDTVRRRLAGFRDALAAQTMSEAAPLFLKYPLSALLIPEIAGVFDLRLVYALRPFAAIEATRLRRRWAEALGAAGAGVIYSRMFEVLVERELPTLMLRYGDLLAAPAERAAELAAFCGLPGWPDRIDAAARLVRRQGTG